jgi:YbbR domain-containing protein
MRDLFTKDLGWKLFSLLLAMALWLIANRILHETNTPAPETITYDNLPVILVGSSLDTRPFHLATTTVRVTVTGPAANMRMLQAAQIHATASLTGMGTERDLSLPVEVSAPSKIAVVNIEPDRVKVIVPQR